MDHHSQQDLKDIWKKINNLDFSMVIKKMARDQGWRLKQAQEVAMQYPVPPPALYLLQVQRNLFHTTFFSRY